MRGQFQAPAALLMGKEPLVSNEYSARWAPERRRLETLEKRAITCLCWESNHGFFCSPSPWPRHCTDRDAVGKTANSLISFSVYRVSHVATDNHQVIVYWIV